jgi:formylglycine-generating enzyme required for sulfatase activity
VNLPAEAQQLEPLPVDNATAATPAEMKPYDELIDYTRVTIPMIPIAGGKFLMGSPADEANRNDDEGPQREVTVDPFWMSQHEITWDSYDTFMSSTDILIRQVKNIEPVPRDALIDAVTRPTEPYTDMTFGMGKRGYPAVCMTQHAARQYCHWLSAKTGRYYRLPTEAEWEYACRAGSTTAYSFGDNPAELPEHAWFDENTKEQYEKVGLKKPNPWGLYDMHGNVAEWVLDQYSEDGYPAKTDNPLAIPTTLFPRVVRGGGWDSEAAACRSAARVGSDELWKSQDPQLPQSIWYHTDALAVGFRIVRPLKVPSAAERAAKWDKSEPLQIDEER